jgi:hypothetical protein
MNAVNRGVCLQLLFFKKNALLRSPATRQTTQYPNRRQPDFENRERFRPRLGSVMNGIGKRQWKTDAPPKRASAGQKVYVLDTTCSWDDGLKLVIG